MDFKILEELENKELEKLDKLIDDISLKLENGQGLDYADLYPELQSKIQNKVFTNCFRFICLRSGSKEINS